MGLLEDEILRFDRRGVSRLAPHLAPDYCDRAAAFMLEQRGLVFIATGFYILHAGAPETDGPPGAIWLGTALTKLGYAVRYITDERSSALMRGLAPSADEVLEFPITDADTSDRRARELLDAWHPALMVATERCGRTADGRYLNARGFDISEHNANLDSLFDLHPRTVGVGDGGNEIGMGNLAAHIPGVPGLPTNPCTTRVNHLVVASVSNWGVYGLIAAIARHTGQSLLPTVEQERELLERALALGAVDPMRGSNPGGVDGFSLDDNSAALERIRGAIEQ